MLFLRVFENGCACKYFLPRAECSGVVERETAGTNSGVKLFSMMGARCEKGQMLRSAEVFSFSHPRSTYL